MKNTLNTAYGFEIPEVPTGLNSFKENSKYRGNPQAGSGNPDMIQKPQMPNRKGNVGYNGRTAGPVTAKLGVNVESGARKWDPKCEQNYVGNPDKMQERQLHNRKGNMK